MSKAAHNALPPELRRTERVTCLLRPGQAVDLEAIAEGWGVPVGVVAYCVLADWIESKRGLVARASKRDDSAVGQGFSELRASDGR